MEKKEVIGIVKNCIKEYLVSQIDNFDLKEIEDNFRLIGKDTILDSIGLVSIIIDIESAFLDKGYEISLTSEKAMSQKNSPFRSVQALADYVYEQIGQ